MFLKIVWKFKTHSHLGRVNEETTRNTEWWVEASVARSSTWNCDYCTVRRSCSRWAKYIWSQSILVLVDIDLFVPRLNDTDWIRFTCQLKIAFDWRSIRFQLNTRQHQRHPFLEGDRWLEAAGVDGSFELFNDWSWKKKSTRLTLIDQLSIGRS